MIFETERLQLVPLGPDRAEQLAEVYADPDVSRYVGGDSLIVASTREQAAWFEQVWHERGYGQSAVIERVTGHLIGRIGLSFWPTRDSLQGRCLARLGQPRRERPAGHLDRAVGCWTGQSLKCVWTLLGLAVFNAVVAQRRVSLAANQLSSEPIRSTTSVFGLRERVAGDI